MKMTLRWGSALLTITAASLSACGETADRASSTAEGTSAPAVSDDIPAETLPVLPADDGYRAGPVSAPGDADYLEYQTVCGLSRFASYDAELVVRPADEQPEPMERQDGNAVLRLAVGEVISAEDGVTFDAEVDVLVAALDGVRFKGSGVLSLWPELRGDAEHVFLYRSPDPAVPWYMLATQQNADGVRFVPNDCNTTDAFAGFAALANRTNDLDLLRSLHVEQVEYEKCLVEPGANAGSCPQGELLVTAFTAQFGEEPVVDLAAQWRDTDPSDRSLAFGDIDPAYAPKLVLLPVVVVNQGIPTDAAVSLVCSLGVGYRWQSTPPLVLATSACRGESLVLQLGGGSGEAVEGVVEIGRIDPAQFNEADGIELTIDWTLETPKLVSVRTLPGGELERILGVSQEELEALRAQYMTTNAG